MYVELIFMSKLIVKASGQVRAVKCMPDSFISVGTDLKDLKAKRFLRCNVPFQGVSVCGKPSLGNKAERRG